MPASTSIHPMSQETYKWVTDPIPYNEVCDRCFKTLRGDSQIIERHGLRYHLGCFLDYATAQMNFQLLQNAREDG